MGLRHALVRLTHPLLRRAYQRWGRRPRTYRADGLELVVLPGVFHPGMFWSTRALWHHLRTLPLEGRSFLELGAGSGFIAFSAAARGAIVTASDISAQAIKGLELNRERTHLPITVVRSDLFEHLAAHFDVIAINPPYYARDPKDDSERAFLAGSDLGYFRKLFPALASRIAHASDVYLVLSADLDLAVIQGIAAQSGLTWREVARKRSFGEAQVVLQVATDR